MLVLLRHGKWCEYGLPSKEAQYPHYYYAWKYTDTINQNIPL